MFNPLSIEKDTKLMKFIYFSEVVEEEYEKNNWKKSVWEDFDKIVFSIRPFLQYQIPIFLCRMSETFLYFIFLKSDLKEERRK